MKIFNILLTGPTNLITFQHDLYLVDNVNFNDCKPYQIISDYNYSLVEIHLTQIIVMCILLLGTKQGIQNGYLEQKF